MRKWMWRSIAIVAVLAVAGGAAGFTFLAGELDYGPPADRSAWVDQPPSLHTAGLAYIQRDVAGAREIWLSIATDDGAEAEDRGEAYRYLARTSWRIYQNTDEAIAYAEDADAADPGAWQNADTLSAAYRAQGNTDAAIAAAREAVVGAIEPTARNTAAATLARAALAAVHGKPLDQLSAPDRVALGEAQTALSLILEETPAPIEISTLAIGVATRLDDGDALFRAWGSYYHSPAGVSAMSDQAAAAAILSEALPRWPHAAQDGDRRAIITALAQSFFFEEAALLATDGRDAASSAFEDDSEIQDIVAVSSFVHDITRHADEYYRQIAAANSNSPLTAAFLTMQFRIGRDQVARTLWSALNLEGDFNDETLTTLMRDRFLTYYNEGSTSGVYDLHAGFRVLDTVHEETQYGRSAELNYVVVGRMISNGYESWLWDGRQQHGGWASADTIYHVRPAYADSGLSRWDQVSNATERQDAEDEIASLTAEDATHLGDHRLAYLPGLAARLRWQGMNAVLDDARRAPGEIGMRNTYILDMAETIRGYSIFAHEGRHALDKLHADEAVRDSSEELEFRAKISEVAFSNQPRLALGSIHNPNLGDGTPHGDANARLLEGVLEWMERNTGEIEGLDSNAPLWPQFDLLTDDQIRAAFLWQDPWAIEGS